MYSYLMKGAGWSGNRATIPADRYIGLSDSTAGPQFELVDGIAPPTVLELPALFVPELDYQQRQLAHIGKIGSAHIERGEIHIEYMLDSSIPPIPFHKIVESATQLGIATSGYALSHTHWAVKSIDLFKALLRIQSARIPGPTVFDLDDEQPDRTLVGVMMPFAPAFDRVYDAIKASGMGAGLRFKRADDLWLHPRIMQTIVSLICQSRVVIADCSGRNPNVFYEAGIAHTLNKDVILLAQDINDVPFDLRPLSVLLYRSTPRGLRQLTIDLNRRIDDVMRSSRRA